MELPKIDGVDTLSHAIRFLPGGRLRFVEAVKLASDNGDPSAKAWWGIYADLTPSERKRCNFGDVALAAGVTPASLLAGVVGHTVEAGHDAGMMIAAIYEPSVVAAMASSAAKVGGPNAEISQQDRVQFLQGKGFLPVPKGTSIHLHANASANAQAAAVAATDPSVPKFASDIAALADPKADVQKALASAPLEEHVIDVDPVHSLVDG